MAHDDLLLPGDGSAQAGRESVKMANGVGARSIDPRPSSRTEVSMANRGGSGALRYVFLSVMSVGFGMLGAYLYHRYLDPLISASDHPASAAPLARGEATTSSPAPVSEQDSRLAADLGALKSQYDDLMKRTEGLKERLDSLPKSDESPHLTSLQLKVADLSKSAADVAELPGKVERIDSRLERLCESVELLQSAVGGAQPSSSTSVPTHSSRTGSLEAEHHEAGKPVLSEAVDRNRHAMTKGSQLFVQGRYQESFDIFSQLELTDPDDARVWYYAALSRGLATNKWGNGTEQLVERGVERERAGTPKSGDIDNAFRDLTTSTGKDWLNFYRQRVKEK